MSSVELVSVHVPKTGGTAFRSILERVYGAERVHTVYPTAAGNPTAMRSHEEWMADSVALCRLGPLGPRVVHGHYLMGIYADRFPDAATVTWLRHPVDRIVSFYFMWREMTPWPRASPLQMEVHDGTLDLRDFARTPALRDHVTRTYLGSSGGRDLTFIGIQERFDDDVARLGALLDWPSVEAPRLNVNQTATYVGRDVDAATRAEIERLNPNDMRLYREVLEGVWRPSRARPKQTRRA